MAFVEGCKHELEVIIPTEDVLAETAKVAESFRAKANLPGFRPGKAPLSMIRSRFSDRIKQEVLENLVPRFLRKKVEEEHLDMVGTPEVSGLHYHEGQDVHFKVTLEVAPEIELKEYRGVTVAYAPPEVDEAELNARINEIRKSKADYANIDPRPAESGDVAVIDLVSVGGLEGEPMKAEELQVELGSEETVAGFNDLLGVSPGDTKNITIEYPANYGQERLAGKTVEFSVYLRRLQRKELPELNDDFAKDLGDFQTYDELIQAIRTNMQREKEYSAQRAAKDSIVDKLAEMHPFPVPDTYVDRQVEIYIDQIFQGHEKEREKVDFKRVKEAMHDRAVKEIRGSLVLDKIATAETIHATQDEVDGELNRYAKQQREPVAAVRKRFQENGTIGRIASSIRTEKTLNFLFENARKEAPVATTEPSAQEKPEA
ncbi:MAG: trigger factor [Acidobacteria bacterium]|nr:trigger factor [Acidobacteriota bacterium]